MLAIQMQSVCRCVYNQKCVGVAIAQQCLALLQKLLIYKQGAVILTSVAEQCSKRQAVSFADWM